MSGYSGDLYELIQRRRDVRAEFAGTHLKDALVLKILAAAHAAPSVGMTQPWDFILVRDENLRSEFQRHVAHERKLFADTLTGPQARTFDPIKIEGIMESGLGLVVTYDPSRGAPAVLGRNSIDDTGLYSTCLAIQNLWLAATAEGLGVGWVSFYREDFLQRLLGIPGTVRPVAWLCLGEITTLQTSPDLERFGWRARRPLAEAVHYDKY